MTFAENEYQGIEQNGTMKRIPTTKVKQGIRDGIDDAINAIKGVGYTEGSLKTHEDRLDTLEADDTTEGSVAKTVKDNAKDADYDGSTSGITAETLGGAIDELDGKIDTLEGRVDTTELTLARQGQDLASVKQTLQQGNGATLDFSGIGSEALDARATGRANPTVEGLTATNLVENGDFSDGTTGWNAASAWVSIDVVDNALEITEKSYSMNNRYVSQSSTFNAQDVYFISFFAKSSGDTDVWVSFGNSLNIGSNLGDATDTFVRYSYVGSRHGTGSYFRIGFIKGEGQNLTIYGVTLINLTQTFGADNEPDLETCKKLFSNYFDGTKSIQLPARIISKSEDESETSTIYIADNEEVRSIQDVQDTLTMVNGEYIYTKKVSTPAFAASGVAVNVTNYPTAKTDGKFAVELTAGGTQIGVIGTDSTSGDGMLRYELATPTIPKLLTSGILQAKQNGTVYFEPYYEGSHQTDASSKITLPYTGTIDKLTGYDENLEPYEVPSTSYTLVGTLLTITGAEENEVFYVELSRAEPLAPEMGVNTLNNMVVPTIVNASTYTVLEGDHTLLVNYTATGACTITIPTALILAYKRLVIKDSGGGAATKNIIIGTQGTEKIDGVDTYVINTAKGKVELASDGANMWVVG